MKNLRNLFSITAGLIILLVAGCNKEDFQILPEAKLNPEYLMMPVDNSGLSRYLSEIKSEIEALLSSGTLNRGNANSLIVKINNAIKSAWNNNTSAIDGQLSSIKNELNDFIDNEIIPESAGMELLSSIESGIILNNGSFTDPLSGYDYPVVLIGDQLWMEENLRVTKFNDGTAINQITDNVLWVETTGPAFCWYENNYDGYGSVYGALYNWYAVENGKLCPSGWHVPSSAEYAALSQYLGGDPVAGGKMKETGTDHWQIPNTGATNESGFNSLPGGLRMGAFDGVHDGTFNYIQRFGCWWTTTEPLNTGPFELAYNVNNFYAAAYFTRSGMNSKKTGLSVRCVKD